MAQQELEARRKENRQHSSKSIFISKLVCGDCGCFFGSKVCHSTDKYRIVVWQYNNKFKADEKCSTPHIKEGVIKAVFIKALNSIVTDKGPALDMMDHLKAKIDDTDALEGKLEKAATAFDKKMVRTISQRTRSQRRSWPMEDTQSWKRSTGRHCLRRKSFRTS